MGKLLLPTAVVGLIDYTCPRYHVSGTQLIPHQEIPTSNFAIASCTYFVMIFNQINCIILINESGNTNSLHSNENDLLGCHCNVDYFSFHLSMSRLLNKRSFQ